ncbi:hypothetical protein ES703_46198 [subsurface metagenome]
MATSMALSVPGRIGIQGEAQVAALLVNLGSMQMILVPLSFACVRYHRVSVPKIVSAGLHPQRTIILELSKSALSFPV